VVGRRERFFVKHASWVGDIVRQVIEGGHWVEDIHGERVRRSKRAPDHLPN
jgi:hypothetical protein